MSEAALTMNLEAATERLYRAFEGTRRSAHMRGCPHCVSGDMARDLCTRPLRELAADDIGPYAFKAMTTWGDEEDYRHFFPRILELCDVGRSGEPGLATWVMRGKLELAGWRSWPSPQLEAIELYLDALFQRVLMGDPHDHGVAYAIEELAPLKIDIAPWLSAWERTDSLVADRQLANAVLCTWEHIARTGLAFRADDQGPPSVMQNARAFAAWLRAPAQRARLGRAFDEHGAGVFGAELAEAVDAYQWL